MKVTTKVRTTFFFLAYEYARFEEKQGLRVEEWSAAVESLHGVKKTRVNTVEKKHAPLREGWTRVERFHQVGCQPLQVARPPYYPHLPDRTAWLQ